MNGRGPVVLLSVWLALGCADSHGRESAGGDGGEGSTPAARDCARCGDGEHCLRGVCVATCGGDPSVFDDWLAPNLRPVVNLCRQWPAEDGALAARASGDDGFELVRFRSEPVDRHTTFELHRYTGSLASGEYALETSCSVGFDGRTPDARWTRGRGPRRGLARALPARRVRRTHAARTG